MDNKKVLLDEIFSPRGVAVVGASATKMGFAEMVLHSLIEAEFPAIYPVNPKYNEVMGLRCYPDIKAIPGIVDHVVVNIPAEAALKLLDDCAAKGVKSVHFFTAGFGESGYEDRAELEMKMLDKARAGGFRIIGPNCVGLFAPKSRLVNSINIPLDPGPIAFISQSGGHAQYLPYHGGPRGLRFSKVVSYGNALDVNECELMEYFAEDRETEIIAAYIEGVRDGKLFIKALKKAASKKPVVIYKGGKTEAGKRAAHGHTASMTSSIEVFEALCRQMNTIQADSLDEVIDTLAVLSFVKPFPEGKRVALIGAGGGPSVLAGDEMEKEGLSMPGFSVGLREELKKHLPIAGSIFTNPLDTPNLIDPKAISAAMNILGKSPEVDMLVYHLGFHPISTWGVGRLSSEHFLKPAIDVMKEAITNTGKPVLIAMKPPMDMAGMLEFLEARDGFVKAGLPVFFSLGQLARAMVRVMSWAENRTNRVTV